MPSNNIIPLHRGTILPMPPARAPARVAPDSQKPAPVSFVDQIEARYRDDRPDLFQALRENARREPTWGEEIAQDWREIVSEVRGSPWSHACVAILAIIFWTIVLITPLLFGARS
jgi:hypothetical protein